MPNLRAAGRDLRVAFAALDEVDLPLMFERRAVVMRSIPFFLRGPCRNAVLMALEEICASEDIRKVRGVLAVAKNALQGWNDTQVRIGGLVRQIRTWAMVRTFAGERRRFRDGRHLESSTEQEKAR